MVDHDGGYKLLFGNQRMVEDLVRGFVQEPWVDRLDFSTLERCEGSYVTEGSGRRELDMVWRLLWEGEGKRGEETGREASWLYVYLLLEFQSRVERFMAVRMLNYLSLLYLDLVKRRELTESGKLPPVLPLVLCNGERRGSAPRQVSELIETVTEELLQQLGDTQKVVVGLLLRLEQPVWRGAGHTGSRSTGAAPAAAGNPIS
jgi:hypothetical protein